MKNAFELHFHWIFIMIIGTIILTFFFTIAYKQRELSTQKLAHQLSTDLNAVFTAALAAKGVTQTLLIPRTGVTFTCTTTCDCNYYINQKATPFQDIYTQETLTDPAVIVWSIDWKLPFRATNFLLIGQPSTKYLFVTDTTPHSTQLHKKISQDIPTAFDTSFTTQLNTKDITSNTRLIYLATTPGTEINNLPNGATALQIDPTRRKLTYYTPTLLGIETHETSYAGDALMYAAIFTTNPQHYQCGISTALDKLSRVTTVHTQRAKNIEQAISTTKPECAYPTDLLEQYTNLASQQTTQPNPNLAQLEQTAQQLNQHNENLILHSCPEMY